VKCRLKLGKRATFQICRKLLGSEVYKILQTESSGGNNPAMVTMTDKKGRQQLVSNSL